jgi:hypothetical protein
MYGTVVDVIDASTFWLLQVRFGRVVAETPVEHRPMASIVQGEAVSSPTELIGRRVWISKDGNRIAFINREGDSS